MWAVDGASPTITQKNLSLSRSALHDAWGLEHLVWVSSLTSFHIMAAENLPLLSFYSQIYIYI